jgi:hypothetical protein
LYSRLRQARQCGNILAFAVQGLMRVFIHGKKAEQQKAAYPECGAENKADGVAHHFFHRSLIIDEILIVLTLMIQ